MKDCTENNCLPDILDSFNWTEVVPGATCYPWDITPPEYLHFAEQDLSEGGQRAAINSISNSKRAIHSHVDFLLHNCGRCLQRSRFPEKLDLLQQLGIIAPSLLAKYNKLRNVIEHDYASATDEDALEVLDVAKLFIVATRQYTQPLPCTLVFQAQDGSQTLVLNCHWDERLICATISSNCHGARNFRISAFENTTSWLAWVAHILKMMCDASDPYIRCRDVQINVC